MIKEHKLKLSLPENSLVPFWSTHSFDADAILLVKAG